MADMDVNVGQGGVLPDMLLRIAEDDLHLLHRFAGFSPRGKHVSEQLVAILGHAVGGLREHDVIPLIPFCQRTDQHIEQYDGRNDQGGEKNGDSPVANPPIRRQILFHADCNPFPFIGSAPTALLIHAYRQEQEDKRQ